MPMRCDHSFDKHTPFCDSLEGEARWEVVVHCNLTWRGPPTQPYLWWWFTFVVASRPRQQSIQIIKNWMCLPAPTIVSSVHTSTSSICCSSFFSIHHNGLRLCLAMRHWLTGPSHSWCWQRMTCSGKHHIIMSQSIGRPFTVDKWRSVSHWVNGHTLWIINPARLSRIIIIV